MIPRCTVIVVSYNSARELPACLESIRAQERVDVDLRIVDNASADGSLAVVQSVYPGARVTANSVNVGFARANNQILEGDTAEYVALVNPDAELAPSALATCLAYLQQHSDVAVVGTRLSDADGKLQPSCHGFLGLRNLLGEALLLDRIAPHSPLGSLHMRAFRHDRVRDVDWIQGAFLVVRRSAYQAVGALDASFFMYGEEMDWCYRLRQAGWRVVFLPGPPVRHVGGASSRPIAGAMFVEQQKSRLRFLRKHRSPLVVGTSRILIALGIALRALAWEAIALVSRLWGRRAREHARLRVDMFRAVVAWVLRGMPIEERVGGLGSALTQNQS